MKRKFFIVSALVTLLVSLVLPYQINISLRPDNLSVSLAQNRAYAAVDFSSSFENGFSDWDKVTQLGAAASISADWASNGSHSLKISGIGDSEDRAYVTHYISNNPMEIWASCDVMLPVIPNISGSDWINSLGPDVYGVVGPLYRTTDKRWGIMMVPTPGYYIPSWSSTSYPINAGQKFTIQLHFRRGTNGLAELWINDVLVHSVSMDMNAVSINDFFVGMGWHDARSADFTEYFDNVEYSESGKIPYAGNPQPPVAQDDNYSLLQDTVLNISVPGVLANDTDANDDALTSVKVAGPAHGSLAFNNNGSFTYVPDPGYIGTDKFTYKANDGKLDSNIASVNIQILRLNHTPEAQNESYSIDEDTSLNINAPGILGNDFDADGDPLVAVNVGDPEHGTITLNADGSFIYLPDEHYYGLDSFMYQAYDGQSVSNTAMVSIAIASVEDVPLTEDDGYVTSQNIAVNIAAPGVLDNDCDKDGDLLTAVLVSGPDHGALTFSADGGFLYNPDVNYIGIDKFTYYATDGKADSTIATANITVSPAIATFGLENGNQTSNQGSNYLNVMRFQNTASTGTLTKLEILFDDTTPAGRVRLGVYSDNNGAPGSLHLDAGEVTVVNGWVSIEGLNLPVTQNTYYWLAFNLQSANRLRYQSNGPLRSHYWVRSIYGDLPGQYIPWGLSYSSNQIVMRATVITIVNVPPVAVDDTFSIGEDAVLTPGVPGVLDNDYDMDGDQITAAKLSDPAHGALLFNADGSFTYTPAANFNGFDSFTYQVNDGKTISNRATVNIRVAAVNDVPVAQNDSYSTNQNSTLSITAPGVLGNDTDADGEVLTATLITGPARGTMTFSPDGGFVYIPVADYLGSDSFTYYISDTVSTSNTATVSIVVSVVNVAPVAANDTYIIDEDSVLIIPAPGILANDTDANGDSLTATLVSGVTHGTLTLNINGSFTFTPAANYSGNDSFTYRASDGKANSNIASVTIAVNSVNDAPLAVNDSYTVVTGNILTVTAPGVLGNDTDVDGDSLTAIKINEPSHGVLTLLTNGSLTYTPESGYSGDDTFTYKAFDGITDSNIVSVSITITSATATFGLDAGSANFHVGSDMLDVMRFQNTAGAGLLTKLELLFDDTSPNGKVRMGIYADNNGRPGSLLLDAGEAVVKNGWVSIEGLSLPVTQGTYYWLAFGLQRDNYVKRQVGEPNSHYWLNRGYGTMPSSYSGGIPDAGQFVMRATVTR